jgi:hypothetical protein
VKSHNFSFHVIAVSYDIIIINCFTTPNTTVSLMDMGTSSSPHNCNYTVLILLDNKDIKNCHFAKEKTRTPALWVCKKLLNL